MSLRAHTAAGITGLVRDGDPSRTMVLLHGIGGRAETFAGLMQVYPAGARLLAWNAPGYAGSAHLSTSWPVAADYAASLAKWLDATPSSERVDVVGHSLGCLMAAAFTRNAPERVRRLVLMAPAQGYRTAVGGDMPANVTARIDDLRRLGAQAFAEKRAAGLLAAAGTRPDVLATVRDAMAALDVEGYAQAVRMLASGDLPADLAAIRNPILVMNGTADTITPASAAKALVEDLARDASREPPRLELVEDAGHAVSIEQPRRVAALLSTFLEAP